MNRASRRPSVPVVLAVLATAGLALTGLSACGGSSGAPSSPTTGTSAPMSGGKVRYGTLTGLATTIDLTPSFVTTLSSLSATPSVGGSAKLSGRVLSFPITGGSAAVDPAATPAVSGTVEHSGSLTITAGGYTVELSDPTITLGATSVIKGTILLNGKSFGSQLPLFDIDTGTARTPATTGGSTAYTGATVYADPAAATSLNLALQLTGTHALPTTAKAIEVGTLTLTLKG